jgi:tight adherence protein C
VIPVLLATGWAAVVVAIGRAHRSVTRPSDLVPARPRVWRCRRATPLRQLAPILAGGLLGGLLIGPVGVVAIIGLLVLLRRARSARAARRAAAARAARLPDAIDLLTISVESGLAFDAAIQQVARAATGPNAARFAVAGLRTRAGSCV